MGTKIELLTAVVVGTLVAALDPLRFFFRGRDASHHHTSTPPSHEDDRADRMHIIVDDLRADKALAASVAAKGTPTFFINGVRLVGAQPLIKFTVEVDRQLDVARALAGEKGLSGDALYRAAVESNRARR